MRLFLIRHPQPEIAAGICYGQTDLTVAVHECDKVSAELVTKLLILLRKNVPPSAPHVRLVTSPLRRCAELAEKLASGLTAGLAQAQQSTQQSTEQSAPQSAQLSVEHSAEQSAQQSAQQQSRSEAQHERQTAAPTKTVPVIAEYDARLMELDFGHWENQAWDTIPRAALDAWAENPVTHAPGGGETVLKMSLRVANFMRQFDPASLHDTAGIFFKNPAQVIAQQSVRQSVRQSAQESAQQSVQQSAHVADCIIVSHAGTIRQILAYQQSADPQQMAKRVLADHQVIGYGECIVLEIGK